MAVSDSAAHLCPPLPTCDHSAMLGNYSSIAVPGLIVVGTSVHLAAVLLGRHQDVKGRPLEEKTSATNPLLIGQDINPSLCWLEWAFRFLVRFGFGTCHRLGLVLVPDVRSKFRQTLYPGRIRLDLRLKTVWTRTYNLCQTALALCSNFHPPRQLIQN